MKYIDVTLFCMALLVMLGLPESVLAQPTYTEDFTTTVYKDEIQTTAHWNSAAGLLQLRAFTPGIVGSVDTPDRAWGLDIEGNLLYLADFTAGLHVIDISDPALPNLLATYDSPGQALDVVVDGDWAYLSDDASGVLVLDVRDPANPTPVGSFNPTAAVRGVCVSGDYLYVTGAGDGLFVLDVTTPSAPTLLTTLALAGATHKVWIEGDIAYVAARFDTGGFHVVDVSDPNNPVLLATRITVGSTTNIHVSGNFAYVADGGVGLVVFDVTDPASPIEAANLAVPGGANEVYVGGDWAYLASAENGIHVIDISDPANPTITFTCDTPTSARAVEVAGDHAFVADAESGLQVIEVSEPTYPMIVGGYDGGGAFATSIAVSGDHAFIQETTGLTVVDITDPTNPAFMGELEALPGDYLRDIAISGDYAFIAGQAPDLSIIDISDPMIPALVGFFDTVESASAVAVSGDHAFVSGSSGLMVIDISRPTSPTLSGVYGTTNYSYDVAVSGDYAFVAEYSLLVIDISDPTNPTLLGTGASGIARGVAVSGNHAFVATVWGGLKVFDITDPNFPSLAGSCDTPGDNNEVAISGDYAFVAVDDYGLQVVDITDPTNPVPTEICETLKGYGVTISGDHAFVANSHGGLLVIQVFQSEVDTDNNVGQSYAVDLSDDTILAARLTTTQTNSIGWELSADGGINWQIATPGGNWTQFGDWGVDLLWRSTHSWGAPGVNPTVTNLTLEWLNESALISSVSDFPNDQGKQVRVEWSRSGHDFLGDASQITEYAVYRQIDPDLTVASKRAAPVSLDGLKPNVRENALMMAAVGWDFLVTVPVRVEDTYAVVVPTAADSTISEGQYYSTFMVTALTATPGLFFDSPPDSGYSVDNLAPGVPSQIVAAYEANGVTLGWADSPEADLQFYRVYRDIDPGFMPSPANLVGEIAASAWVDQSAGPWSYHYKISALDFAGNESEPGSPSEVTGVHDGTVPAMTALLGAVPNPFNPSTRLSFEMATPGHARLKVYDTAGRLVATLLNEHRDPGSHHVMWDGRDSAGRMSSAGVYLYRLEVDDYVETKRMTLVK